MVKESYNARRKAQARQTRDEVVAAAHRLFLEKGYAATILQIADGAHVGEQTVYRVFDNKAGLLREVILTALSGSDAESMAQEMQDFMTRVASGKTPHDRLRVVADWTAGAYERGVADLEEVVLAAAHTDPRAEELARFLKEIHYQSIRDLVGAVLGDNQPPPDMSLDDIADYIYAVWSAPVYRQLVRDRGWSLDKYMEWCVHMVEQLFLDHLERPQNN